MNNCGNCKHRQNGVCLNVKSDRCGNATPSEYYCDGWVEIPIHSCGNCKWHREYPDCMICTNNKSDNVGEYVNALTGCKEWEKQQTD